MYYAAPYSVRRLRRVRWLLLETKHQLPASRSALLELTHLASGFPTVVVVCHSLHEKLARAGKHVR